MGASSRRDFLAQAGVSAIAASLAGGAFWQRARAAQPWLDRREFGPFQCVGQFPLATLEPVFGELPQLEHELERTLGLPPARDKIEIQLLADEESHRTLLAKLYPRVPYRRALYVQRDRRAAVYAYRHAELPVDLRHECTHALLHANLAMIPLWLDEGLAEYFEMPADQRAFGHPHLAALKWNLRLGMMRSVESLEQRAGFKRNGRRRVPIFVGLGALHVARTSSGPPGIGELPGGHSTGQVGRAAFGAA